jgi:hypothetical protein
MFFYFVLFVALQATLSSGVNTAVISTPHAIILTHSQLTLDACKEVHLLSAAMKDIFVYVASPPLSVQQHEAYEQTCPIDTVFVEADQASKAVDAAVKDAARSLHMFPRANLLLLNTSIWNVNMEAMRSLLIASTRSRKPTLLPVRFIPETKRHAWLILI